MGRHILVINRFDNDSGRYHRYVDHTVDRVSYLTTRSALGPLRPELAQAVVLVEDLADWDEVHARVLEIVARHGAVDHVLALSEFDLELGASVRGLLGVQGPGTQEIRRVRDKVVMKELVSAAGLRVPAFTAVENADTVRSFVTVHGFPVVLKPRRGWDSQGVFLLGSWPSLEKVLTTQPLTDYECEEFVDGQMYQVDGLAHDGVVRISRSSRLLNTCLEFSLGGQFGSVSNPDAHIEKRLARYAQRIVSALGMGTSAFHLEVFQTEHDDLVFLEIGARVGGAQIPFLWREVYGVDLHELWVRTLLGEAPDLPTLDVTGEAAGYLLMPEPPRRPCRVLGARSLLGRVPGLYAEVLPPPGAILDGTGGCRETAGRYRFRAPTAADVEQAIRRVAAEHTLTVVPLPVEPETTLPAPRRAIGRTQSVALP